MVEKLAINNEVSVVFWNNGNFAFSFRLFRSSWR